MWIRFRQSDTGDSAIMVSDVEVSVWSDICELESETLSDTVSWLWKERPDEVRKSDELFAQFVRDRFLVRIYSGDWHI
jgi:hypothetical protein